MWLERSIHSLKTGFACLIGFLLTKLFHSFLQFDQWLIVTIIVVMCAQLSVGSVYFKASIRFLGTTAGSIIAGFTILSFTQNPLIYAGIISLSAIVFSFIATGEKSYSDAATLGAVTTAIILINSNPTILLTLERFLEIAIGLVVATLVSQFVLPINARNHLRRSQSQALHLLAEYYRKVTAQKENGAEAITKLDDLIVESLNRQRKLEKEAKRELLGTRFDAAHFRRLLECERKLLRTVYFLSQLYHETNLHQLLEKNEAWNTFHEKVAYGIDGIATQIEHDHPLFQDIFIPSGTALKKELEETHALDPHEIEYNNALFFCLEAITGQLRKLVVSYS